MTIKKTLRMFINTGILFGILYGISNGVACATGVKLTHVIGLFALCLVAFIMSDWIEKGE